MLNTYSRSMIAQAFRVNPRQVTNLNGERCVLVEQDGRTNDGKLMKSVKLCEDGTQLKIFGKPRNSDTLMTLKTNLTNPELTDKPFTNVVQGPLSGGARRSRKATRKNRKATRKNRKNRKASRKNRKTNRRR